MLADIFQMVFGGPVKRFHPAAGLKWVRFLFDAFAYTPVSNTFNHWNKRKPPQRPSAHRAWREARSLLADSNYTTMVGLNDVQRKCDGQKHLLVFRRNSSNPATIQRDSDAGRVLRVTNSSFIWVLGHIFAFNPCGFLLIHRYRDQSIHNKCLNMQVYLSFTSGFKKSILKGVYWSWSIKAISSFYLVLVTWHRVIKASDIPQEGHLGTDLFL